MHVESRGDGKARQCAGLEEGYCYVCLFLGHRNGEKGLTL